MAGGDAPVAMKPEAARKSDLPTRIGSAVVMVCAAAICLWRGGWLLDALVVLVAGAAYWEWQRIVQRMGGESGFSSARSLAWMLGGALYIGGAAWLLAAMPAKLVLFVILVTAFVDTFAYFAGRTIGGPKIAPAVSPSKTWAGLGGGVIGAALALLLFLLGAHLWAVGVSEITSGAVAPDSYFVFGGPQAVLSLVAAGAVLAVLAQAGDFFESWLKRRAKMKDSSALIPGHGGVLDRIDGLLPVSILVGVLAQAAG